MWTGLPGSDGEAGVPVQHNFPTRHDTLSKTVSFSKPFPSSLLLVLGAQLGPA